MSLADQAEPRRTTRRLAEVDLAVWETPGSGGAVVLLHGAVGHGGVWNRQHRSFGASGHRVISYSRRGHHGSGTGPAERPGTGAQDLLDLLDVLNISRAHVVGTALGSFTAIDLALSHPERVQSLTVSSSLCGIIDEAFVETTRRLVPAPWHHLPPTLRELGPAYRAESPTGASLWEELVDEQQSRVEQRARSTVTIAALGRLAVPALFLTGDADPYMPPGRMAAVASAARGAAFATIPLSGHSPYWERPEIFDALVLEHMARHPSHRASP